MEEKGKKKRRQKKEKKTKDFYISNLLNVSSNIFCIILYSYTFIQIDLWFSDKAPRQDGGFVPV